MDDTPHFVSPPTGLSAAAETVQDAMEGKHGSNGELLDGVSEEEDLHVSASRLQAAVRRMLHTKFV